MTKSNKFCITFAGAIGASKTPIAHHLSCHLNLPVFCHDAIRREVIEDLGIYDKPEFIKRRNARAQEVMKKGIAFIYDASVDREWKQAHEWLVQYGYRWFIISLDLSPEKLTFLYEAKKYNESLARLDALVEDHANFLQDFQAEIGLSITDETFDRRLELSLQAVQQWL